MAKTERNVKGLAELDAVLKSLPAVLEYNVVRSSLRAGLKPVQQAAVALVPKDSGALAQSIKIKLQAKSKKYGWVRYHLTAGDKRAWYAHLVEFGTASFYTGSGRSKRRPYEIKAKDGGSLKFGNAGQVEKVTHPGAKPSPFMRPALDANTDAALQAFANTARRRTESEIRKLVRAKGRAALQTTDVESLTDA